MRKGLSAGPMTAGESRLSSGCSLHRVGRKRSLRPSMHSDWCWERYDHGGGLSLPIDSECSWSVTVSG